MSQTDIVRETAKLALTPDRYRTTREVALSAGVSNTAAFRALSQLESEGVVLMKFGAQGIGNVGWRLAPVPSSFPAPLIVPGGFGPGVIACMAKGISS